MFLTKAVETIEAHSLSSITFFRKSIVYEIICNYCRTRRATDDNIIRRKRFACWVPKATDTLSEYVMLIVFPRLQWLRERDSISRYTCIACFIDKAITLQIS